MLVSNLKLNRKQTINFINLNYILIRDSLIKTKSNNNTDPIYRTIYNELKNINPNYSEEDFIKLNYLLNGTNPFKNEIDYQSSLKLIEFIERVCNDLCNNKTNIKVSDLVLDPLYKDILQVFDKSINSRINMDHNYVKNEELLMIKVCDVIDYMTNHDIDRNHNLFNEYFMFYLIKAYFSNGNIGCTINYLNISEYYNLSSYITCRDIGNILNASFKNIFETRLLTSFANEINSYSKIKNK